MAVKIQLRRGTEAEFNDANTTSTITPADGEVLVVQESGTTGGYLLIGNGSSNYVTLRDDVDGRVYFKPGYSKTVMGGEQPASEIPLTVKGATSQSVPIFVVENKTGNDIFRVSDDESSDGAALVAIESRGQTADVVLSVFGAADQDDDNAGGDLLRVQPDAGQVGKGLAVDHSGNVSIVPVDDAGVTDSAFRVTASNDSDNPIMRVQEADGTDLFKIAQGSSVFVKTLNLGNTPNHADPSNFGVVRSATTPNNTDSGADATHHLDDPHFRAKVSGSGTSMIGELELAGNSAAGASQKAITVVKNGTSENLAEIDYSGRVTADRIVADTKSSIDGMDGTQVFNLRNLRSILSGQKKASGTLNVTSRIQTGLRIQEIPGNTDGTFTTELHTSLLNHTVERTTNSNTTTSDPDLQTTPASNVFEIFKVPNLESCTATISLQVTGNNSIFGGQQFNNRITAKTQVYSYTSKDLVTGKTLLAENEGTTPTGGTGGTTTVTTTHTITNSTGSDLFLAVACRARNNDNASSKDHLTAATLTVTFTGTVDVT